VTTRRTRIREGCKVISDEEIIEGSRFLHLCARGPQAKDVLTAEAHRWQAECPALTLVALVVYRLEDW
jgi:hypothetical protein